MLNNLLTYFTSENIYLFANWGVVPFWLLLILAPNHALTNFFAQSIIAPLLLAIGYVYLSYNLYLESNIFDGFNLYYGLDELYSIFANETLLLIFWLHFLAISLFAGSWIVRDQKIFNSKNSFNTISNFDLFFWSIRIGSLLVSQNIFAKNKF